MCSFGPLFRQGRYTFVTGKHSRLWRWSTPYWRFWKSPTWQDKGLKLYINPVINDLFKVKMIWNHLKFVNIAFHSSVKWWFHKPDPEKISFQAEGKKEIIMLSEVFRTFPWKNLLMLDSINIKNKILPFQILKVWHIF